MFKHVFYISLIIFFASLLQAQQIGTTPSSDERAEQTSTQSNQAELMWDIIQAQSSIDVFGTDQTSNRALGTFLNYFLSNTRIAVGLTQSTEVTSAFRDMFERKEPRGTYRGYPTQPALLFHLTFVPQQNNERQYRINIEVKKMPDFQIDGIEAIELRTDIETERWQKFDEHVERINNCEQTYERAEFQTAVNDLVSRGLFILLGMDNFPLEINIRPLSARAIDTIVHHDQRNIPSYEWVTIGVERRVAHNVALKVGDVMPLQILVNRMEIDHIERIITLSDGGSFKHQFSSLNDDVIEFTYTASTTGNHTITATYQTQAEGRSIKQTAGQLNISVFEEIERKIVLVPVQNVGHINEAEIRNFLNAVYGQVAVRWEVEVDQLLQVNRFNGRLQTPTGQDYSTDMNNIIETYRNSRNFDNQTYYIFIVPEFADGRTEGFMPCNSNFGFVAHSVSFGDLGRRIAHELGHGAFGLRHIFEEFAHVREGFTNNLMDHVRSMPQGGSELDISKLYRYQWELIHGLRKTDEEEEENKK